MLLGGVNLLVNYFKSEKNLINSKYGRIQAVKLENTCSIVKSGVLQAILRIISVNRQPLGC